MRLSVPGSLSRLRRLLGAVALLAGATAPMALSSAPAHAAGGCTSQGVTVVVDFGALGGGVQQNCAPGGGKAAALFGAVHHTLGRVQTMPGAVCSVDAKPANPCPQMPPATAYWALFWTDGSSGKWAYSSLGVDALSVPADGSVALAWQSSAGTRAPGIAPAVTKAAGPAAKPTKATTPKHAKTGAKSTKKVITKQSPAPTATARPTTPASVSPSSVASMSPSAKAKKRARASVSAAGSPASSASAPTESATISADSAPISTSSGDSGGGLPGWVAPMVVVVVLGAGGGVAVARRRARG